MCGVMEVLFGLSLIDVSVRLKGVVYSISCFISLAVL